MATWDRYKTSRSGFETRAFKGRNFRPRFYCDEATGVYVTKPPVAVLKLDPVVQFVNTNIAWDVSASVSATGTIDSFDLTFGGGGATNLPAQDWAVDPLTGNVQYNAVGTYQVTLRVTDTLGEPSQLAKQTVHIVTLAGLSRAYVTTDDAGLFAHVSGSLAQVNTGLSGGDLEMASGALNPHYAGLITTQHHFWAATADGIVYTVDGAQTWTSVSLATIGDPTNTAADGTPPESSDLDPLAVVFCPQDIFRVYLFMATDATWNAGSSPRVFVYWSDDYGATWSSEGIGV